MPSSPYTHCMFNFDNGTQLDLAVTASEAAWLIANADPSYRAGGSVQLASAPNIRLSWAHVTYIELH